MTLWMVVLSRLTFPIVFKDPSLFGLFYHRRTLDLNLLTNETANNFANFYSFISQLAWKHKFTAVTGHQSNCYAFFGTSH